MSVRCDSLLRSGTEGPVGRGIIHSIIWLPPQPDSSSASYDVPSNWGVQVLSKWADSYHLCYNASGDPPEFDEKRLRSMFLRDREISDIEISGTPVSPDFLIVHADSMSAGPSGENPSDSLGESEHSGDLHAAIMIGINAGCNDTGRILRNIPTFLLGSKFGRQKIREKIANRFAADPFDSFIDSIIRGFPTNSVAPKEYKDKRVGFKSVCDCLRPQLGGNVTRELIVKAINGAGFSASTHDSFVERVFINLSPREQD